jgi:hypothetical protein
VAKKKNRKQRQRKQFPTWLYWDIPEDIELMNLIAVMKSAKKFTYCFRNGLRLMWSLMAGETGFLLELFPWIADAIRSQVTLAQDNSDLEQQIADLKRIMLEQGSLKAPSSNYPVMKPPAKSPTIEIKSAPAADAGAIADNFLEFIQ